MATKFRQKEISPFTQNEDLRKEFTPADRFFEHLWQEYIQTTYKDKKINYGVYANGDIRIDVVQATDILNDLLIRLGEVHEVEYA